MRQEKKSLLMDYTFRITCGFLLSAFFVMLYYSLRNGTDESTPEGPKISLSCPVQ